MTKEQITNYITYLKNNIQRENIIYKHKRVKVNDKNVIGWEMSCNNIVKTAKTLEELKD